MKHLFTLLSLILCSISIAFAEYGDNYLDIGFNMTTTIFNVTTEH